MILKFKLWQNRTGISQLWYLDCKHFDAVLCPMFLHSMGVCNIPSTCRHL